MPTELKLQNVNYLLKKIPYNIKIKEYILSQKMANYILLRDKILSIYKMDNILNKKIKIYKYFNCDYYKLLGFKSISQSNLYKYGKITQILENLMNFKFFNS